MRAPPVVHSRPVLLALLTGLACVLRLPWLTSHGLWYDEVFSAFVAAHDLRDVVRLAIDDQTNPPGFYYLLGVWARIGSFDDAWLRALPAVTGSLTPAATALAGHAAGLTWRTALLGGVLAAASPLLMEMSVEVRAYSTVALLATAALALSMRIARRAPETPARDRSTGRDVLALAVLNVLLASLHVFGFLAVVGNTLGALAWRRRTRPLLLAAIPATLAILAWLATIAVAASDDRFAGNASWVPAPSVAAVASLAAHTLGHFGSAAATWVAAAALCVSLALAFMRPHGDESADDASARPLAIAALVPPLAVLALYLVTSRSLWLPRYLVATLPPLALVVAAAVGRASAPWRTGLATLAVGWTALAGIHSMGAGPTKPDWASVVHSLSGGQPTVICVLEGYIELPLRHYAIMDDMPVSVRDADACGARSSLRAAIENPRSRLQVWALYRPETELAMLRRLEGAHLGPRVQMSEGLTVTVARRVRWSVP